MSTTFRPPPGQQLSIPGPAGELQAVLEDPLNKGTAASRFAVVCHPHPQFGGTLDNKVVHTVARAFQEMGIPTLRFNFRGVGKSAGAYAAGIGETDDAIAVIDWGSGHWPGAELWLAGFSFGGFVAVRASASRAPTRLVTVAPAVKRFDFDVLALPTCPTLVVQGDRDDVVDPAAVLAWARTLAPPSKAAVIPGAGHFFHGKLNELKDAVLAGI